MRIQLSEEFYSKKSIKDAIYWASNEASIRVEKDGDSFLLLSDNDEKDFEKSFLEKLNDFNLREEISSRTGELKSLIIAKAFYPDMINIEPVGSFVDPVQMDELDETK